MSLPHTPGAEGAGADAARFLVLPIFKLRDARP
jgi:hypothetical protein